VEKKQYSLCLEVLRRLNETGVLANIILIGSWCIPFYKEYFGDPKYISSIKTRDIDFLVPNPSRLKDDVDIPKLLKDLGFIVGFKGSKGYMKLEHPELMIEFLVPERGKGIDNPYPLPKLGMNAVTLRFLIFLSDKTIKVKVENFNLTLPHPANFALRKLIIFQRRFRREKAIKDKSAAVQILKALISKGEEEDLKQVFDNIPIKWQKKIINGLDGNDDRDLLEVLK